MKLNTILTGTILGALTAVVHAGEVPDILWRTNANQYGSFSVVFAPDSASVFSYGGDAKQWRISDTNLLRTFTIPNEEIAAIALSPDGTRLMGRGGTAGLRMWRVSDGAVLFAGDPSGGTSLAFSPADNYVARGRTTGSIGLTGISGESVTGGITYDDIHSGGVNAVAFSPDGSLLLSGGNDSTAKLLRVADGVVFQTFPHRLYVTSVAFSPNGRVLATGVSGGDVRLWSTNGALLHTLAVAGSTTRAIDFSPDGKLLTAASGGLIQFWRVADGAHLVTYDPDPGGLATAVDISPDGKLFAYGGGDLVLARMPAVITETQRVGTATVVCWQGGTGRYQLQIRTNLNVGAWQHLGNATTNTCATNTIVSTNAFFRVLSLPNP